MGERQKITVFLDGIEKEAIILDVIQFENKRYAVFCLEEISTDHQDFYAAEVILNEGYDQLIDIDSNEIRAKILELFKQKMNVKEEK